MINGLFCSIFFTDHFYEVHFGLSGPTYAWIGKNGRKIVQNGPSLGSIFSRLGSKSKKPYNQMNRLFLMILKHLSVWFQLLWGFQKTVLFRSQYFDLWPPIFRVGVMKILFKPIFLDVFLDVDSESVLVFAFGASGSELWPFFWFWPPKIDP